MAATTVNQSPVGHFSAAPPAVRQPCGQGVTHWAAAGRLAPLCHFTMFRCRTAPNSATLASQRGCAPVACPTAAPRRQPAADSAGPGWSVSDRATSGFVAKPCKQPPLCPCPSLFLRACLHPGHPPPAPASVGTSCASAPGPSTQCMGCGFDSAGVGWPVWGRLIALGAAGDGTQEKTVAAMPNGPMRQPRKCMDTARESRKSGSTWSKTCTTTL